MITLKYENKLGILRFGGGNSPFPYKIINIEGLSFVPKQYTTTQYANIPGQIATGGIEPARTITISLDIQKCDTFTMANFNRVLSEPGELYISAGHRRRKIKCRCADFVQDSRRKIYQPLVIQFMCDDPFFEDFNSTKLSLFERKDLISGTFTLPCVFTKRIHRVNIINAGQKETEPSVILYCKSQGENENCNITLTNHTSGVKFILNYKLNKGEEVIINFADRTIKSNMKMENNNDGDLIVYMSNDSFLSKFKLVPGVNDIECIIDDPGCDASAVCEYSSKYIEAVY